MSSGILQPFLGALQASVSVLLTIFSGVLVSQFKLLSETSAKEISKTCVRVFLPALLITNLGSQLHADTGIRYVPVFIWALLYNAISMVIGIVTARVFKLPSWTTAAVTFNNTTALPLLLIQALDSTGILKDLLMSSSDTSSDAVSRAKSYFLVNAMVSNSLTFALGPKLLNGQNEDSPDRDSSDEQGDTDADQESQRSNGDDQEDHSSENGDANEHTSLLPDTVVQNGSSAASKTNQKGIEWYEERHPWTRTVLHFSYQFLNAPLLGGAVGVIIGLIPPLHKAFFADYSDGGVLNAWLTKAIKNLGELFAALQVIVVGVKLGSAMRKMKRGEESGSVPWAAMAVVTLIRYVLWPAISIPLVYVLAKKTGVLGDDPVLWFAMMLMPTGPPAMKLTALADVNGSGEVEKMSIAKFLTISYAISPLLCVAVVGSLRASQAAI